MELFTLVTEGLSYGLALIGVGSLITVSGLLLFGPKKQNKSKLDIFSEMEAQLAEKTDSFLLSENSFQMFFKMKKMRFCFTKLILSKQNVLQM